MVRPWRRWNAAKGRADPPWKGPAVPTIRERCYAVGRPHRFPWRHRAAVGARPAVRGVVPGAWTSTRPATKTEPVLIPCPSGGPATGRIATTTPEPTGIQRAERMLCHSLSSSRPSTDGVFAGRRDIVEALGARRYPCSVISHREFCVTTSSGGDGTISPRSLSGWTSHLMRVLPGVVRCISGKIETLLTVVNRVC